jgi:beta-phosphoglucomutase-like phosphatase (HAD superfamily)
MNPFLIRAVLFDVDGVLTDSEPARFRAAAQALAEVGVPLTREAFQACWLGRTTEAALQDVLGERFARLGPQAIERRNALYEEQMDRIDAFPDAIRLLRRLPPDLRLGIATGARRGEVESILWRAALTESFGTLVTAEASPRRPVWRSRAARPASPPRRPPACPSSPCAETRARRSLSGPPGT